MDLLKGNRVTRTWEKLTCDFLYLFTVCHTRLTSGTSLPLGQDVVLDTMVSCGAEVAFATTCSKILSLECVGLPSHSCVNCPVSRFPWMYLSK